MTEVTCPQCGNTDQSRMGGIEYPGIYDGVAVWLCMTCGQEWDRFPDNKRISSALNDMRERWAEEADDV